VSRKLAPSAAVFNLKLDSIEPPPGLLASSAIEERQAESNLLARMRIFTRVLRDRTTTISNLTASVKLCISTADVLNLCSDSSLSAIHRTDIFCEAYINEVGKSVDILFIFCVETNRRNLRFMKFWR